MIASVQTVATYRLPPCRQSLPSASDIYPIRQIQHPETITRGKRGRGRRGLLYRMGDDGKAGTEGFCVGTVAPSCLQVSVAVPSRWSSRHRVCLCLNDEGIKAESNNGPLPCVLPFP